MDYHRAQFKIQRAAMLGLLPKAVQQFIDDQQATITHLEGQLSDAESAVKTAEDEAELEAADAANALETLKEAAAALTLAVDNALGAEDDNGATREAMATASAALDKLL